jgi:maleylacetoacetate isomerase
MAGEEAAPVVLFGYWRSSSAYRVRIALNLKGIGYESRPVHLVRDGGEQHRSAYLAVNPLGLVPALVHGGETIVQSMAICEYLEEVFPQTPLLPATARERARVRSIAQTIASEIQPMNNLAVTAYLRDQMGQDSEAISRWYARWVERGFGAVEAWLAAPETGRFCHGDRPSLADCYLVPQVYNAERFDCDLGPYPLIRQIAAECRSLPAFGNAAPENQPDAEPA